MEQKDITRRSFLKTAGALGALATCGAAAASSKSLFSDTTPQAGAEEEDHVSWSFCSVNCEGRCALKLHAKDDEVYWVESDNVGDDEFGKDEQIRACQRGRSIRRWLNHPDRLKYPMKRVGERGSGEFERISWDEAAKTIAENYQRILDEYGPAAVYDNYATGGYYNQPVHGMLQRFYNINGGYLSYYGSYSSAQLRMAMTYLYGSRNANSNSDIVNSELVVMFGENSTENKMCGAGGGYQLMEALERGGAKLIIIDPRYSDSVATRADQWIPIRPGTDAALADAIAYVLITEDLVDHEFLDTYTIGYDEDSMPEGAPANASYKTYILGDGEDGTPKDPAWASEITDIPEDTIIDLAHQIAEAKPCGIYQGKGPQRWSNGEQTARAICMLSILTGNVGIHGGNTGSDFSASYTIDGISVPSPDNGVEASISVFSWPAAIDHGTEMTKLNAGVKGVDRLEVPIKLIFNYGGNCLTNQHGDINQIHQILKDTSKCEFIVVWDTFMTDSAKYADILLPDAMTQELTSFAINENAGTMSYAIMGTPATSLKFERRSLYSVLSDVSEYMGNKDEFTEGRTEEEWFDYEYQLMREADPKMPEEEWMRENGIFKYIDPKGDKVAFESFRQDPEANPLKTPSGKIEIYSSQLAEIANTWELDDEDIISPLPVYAPAREGYQDAKEGQLQLIGYHYKGSTHSSYRAVDILQQANRQRLWINPVDADSRGISDGDTVRVFNDRGEIEVEAMVTNRIRPGVMALPQGAWYNPDENGVDKGACINTLTSMHPSPLAKANPSHTILAEVARA